MSSPFPGMDPYLEGDMWQEFHDRLANQISTQLLQQLPQKYVALLAKRYVFDVPALGIVGLPHEQRITYPDVNVVKEAIAPYKTAVLTLPTAEIVEVDRIPALSVEIRDVAERRLITAIEILSPSNKQGRGWKEYRQKREDILLTETHLLELDLLRRGRRVYTASDELPAFHYFVYLNRFTNRKATKMWGMNVRDKLPTVPVPLLPPDPDVVLDLQAAVEACFSLVGYERLLDYDSLPPVPAFSASDQAWLTEQIEKHNAVSQNQ